MPRDARPRPSRSPVALPFAAGRLPGGAWHPPGAAAERHRGAPSRTAPRGRPDGYAVKVAGPRGVMRAMSVRAAAMTSLRS